MEVTKTTTIKEAQVEKDNFVYGLKYQVENGTLITVTCSVNTIKEISLPLPDGTTMTNRQMTEVGRFTLANGKTTVTMNEAEDISLHAMNYTDFVEQIQATEIKASDE